MTDLLFCLITVIHSFKWLETTRICHIANRLFAGLITVIVNEMSRLDIQDLQMFDLKLNKYE